MTTEYDIEEPYWKIEQHAKKVMEFYQMNRHNRNVTKYKSNREHYEVRMSCYKGCLESMKTSGLIFDYDIETGYISF